MKFIIVAFLFVALAFAAPLDKKEEVKEKAADAPLVAEPAKPEQPKEAPVEEKKKDGEVKVLLKYLNYYINTPISRPKPKKRRNPLNLTMKRKMKRNLKRKRKNQPLINQLPTSQKLLKLLKPKRR